MVRHRPLLQVWGAMSAPTLLILTFMQKFMIITVQCIISNYLQYLVMARPSHCIAKIGSESIETPESVRLHAVIDIYADRRVLHEKRWNK